MGLVVFLFCFVLLVCLFAAVGGGTLVGDWVVVTFSSSSTMPRSILGQVSQGIDLGISGR